MVASYLATNPRVLQRNDLYTASPRDVHGLSFLPLSAVRTILVVLTLPRSAQRDLRCRTCFAFKYGTASHIPRGRRSLWLPPIRRPPQESTAWQVFLLLSLRTSTACPPCCRLLCSQFLKLVAAPTTFTLWANNLIDIGVYWGHCWTIVGNAAAVPIVAPIVVC